MFFPPCFLVSHLRAWHVFTEVNLYNSNISQHFMCTKKQALVMSLFYLVIPKKERHTMYVSGTLRNIHSLKKALPNPRALLCCHPEKGVLSQVKKVSSNSHKYTKEILATCGSLLFLPLNFFFSFQCWSWELIWYILISPIRLHIFSFYSVLVNISSFTQCACACRMPCTEIVRGSCLEDDQ